MEVVPIHLVYEEHRLIKKFPVEVVRIHLVYEEYRPITKFSVEVVRAYVDTVYNY